MSQSFKVELCRATSGKLLWSLHACYRGVYCGPSQLLHHLRVVGRHGVGKQLYRSACWQQKVFLFRFCRRDLPLRRLMTGLGWSGCCARQWLGCCFAGVVAGCPLVFGLCLMWVVPGCVAQSIFCRGCRFAGECTPAPFQPTPVSVCNALWKPWLQKMWYVRMYVCQSVYLSVSLYVCM